MIRFINIILAHKCSVRSELSLPTPKSAVNEYHLFSGYVYLYLQVDTLDVITAMACTMAQQFLCHILELQFHIHYLYRDLHVVVS